MPSVEPIHGSHSLPDQPCMLSFESIRDNPPALPTADQDQTTQPSVQSQPQTQVKPQKRIS